MSQTEEKYQVDIKRSVEDYKAYSAIVICSSSGNIFTHVFISLIITSIIVGFSTPFIFEIMPAESFEKLKPFEKYFLLPTITFAVIYYLIRCLTCYLSKASNEDILLPNGSFSREKTLTIDNEGVQEESDCELIRTKWQGIISIDNNDKFILFYVDKFFAYVLPKSSFRSKDEAEAFYKKASELKLQASSKMAESKNPWSRPVNLQNHS